ncbi:MAG: hypothetical protein ABIZ64_09620 [Casimicrobium sp.]|jgi:hypothetical protein
MLQSGEVAKVVDSRQAGSTRRILVTRSEALAALVAVLTVAIWLLASWTATASEIVVSAST